jgi:hypothetical protein
MFIFKHPFTCLVTGPTQCGKTHFTTRIVENIEKMVTPIPKRIIWCKGEDQVLQLPETVEVRDGLEVIEEIDGSEPTLLILDDLMQEAGDEKQVVNLFTKGSHHRNLSVIMLLQNMFHRGKFIRTMSLNTHYMVLFKNPRDAGQIRVLAGQLFPGTTQFLVEAYRQATSRPHGYLLLDFKQDTGDNFRVLSDVLPDEQGFYYVPPSQQREKTAKM